MARIRKNPKYTPTNIDVTVASTAEMSYQNVYILLYYLK